MTAAHQLCGNCVRKVVNRNCLAFLKALSEGVSVYEFREGDVVVV